MKRRIDHIPQPREFLESVREKLTEEWMKLHWIPNSWPPKLSRWDEMAFDAREQLDQIIDTFQPDPPRRRYYGKKGSLRNPFH